jgi:hypothetical protein
MSEGKSIFFVYLGKKVVFGKEKKNNFRNQEGKKVGK